MHHAQFLEKALQLAFVNPHRPLTEALFEAADELRVPWPPPLPVGASTLAEETGAPSTIAGLVVRFSDGGEALATIVTSLNPE